MRNVRFKQVLNEFIDNFQKKRTTTWAASLSFYTTLSLAPLLVLFLTFSSQVNPKLERQFIVEVHSLMGSEAAQMIESIISNAKSRPDLASTSGLLGVLTLLLSASLIFAELRSALNSIFEKEAVEINMTILQSIWMFIKTKILQMGLVLGFLFVIIVSLVVSAVVSAALSEGSGPFPLLLNVSFSLLLYIFLFTVLLRYLPEDHHPWQKAFKGGLITSSLFVVGKELIGVYLGNSALNSSYGAAGSLVVLLAWVYYSSLIIFIGAHFSFILQNSPSSHPYPRRRHELQDSKVHSAQI